MDQRSTDGSVGYFEPRQQPGTITWSCNDARASTTVAKRKDIPTSGLKSRKQSLYDLFKNTLGNIRPMKERRSMPRRGSGSRKLLGGDCYTENMNIVRLSRREAQPRVATLPKARKGTALSIGVSIIPIGNAFHLLPGPRLLSPRAHSGVGRLASRRLRKGGDCLSDIAVKRKGNVDNDPTIDPLEIEPGWHHRLLHIERSARASSYGERRGRCRGGWTGGAPMARRTSRH